MFHKLHVLGVNDDDLWDRVRGVGASADLGSETWTMHVISFIFVSGLVKGSTVLQGLH